MPATTPRHADRRRLGGEPDRPRRGPRAGPVRRPRPDRCCTSAEQRHWSVDRAAKVMGLHPDQIRRSRSTTTCGCAAGALSRTRADATATPGCCPGRSSPTPGRRTPGPSTRWRRWRPSAGPRSLWLHVDAAYGWARVLTAEGEQELAGHRRGRLGDARPAQVAGPDVRRRLPARPRRPAAAGDVRDAGRTTCRTWHPADDEVNYADYGIALTRRFRALKVWLSVQVLGLDWFRRLAAHWLRAGRIRPGPARSRPACSRSCARGG